MRQNLGTNAPLRTDAKDLGRIDGRYHPLSGPAMMLIIDARHQPLIRHPAWESLWAGTRQQLNGIPASRGQLNLTVAWPILSLIATFLTVIQMRMNHL